LVPHINYETAVFRLQPLHLNEQVASTALRRDTDYVECLFSRSPYISQFTCSKRDREIRTISVVRVCHSCMGHMWREKKSWET